MNVPLTACYEMAVGLPRNDACWVFFGIVTKTRD
jgi:hypothetical protein